MADIYSVQNSQTSQQLARKAQGSADGVKALEELVHTSVISSGDVPHITEALIGVVELYMSSGVPEGRILTYIPVQYRSAVQVGLREYAPSL